MVFVFLFFLMISYLVQRLLKPLRLKHLVWHEIYTNFYAIQCLLLIGIILETFTLYNTYWVLFGVGIILIWDALKTKKLER